MDIFQFHLCLERARRRIPGLRPVSTIKAEQQYREHATLDGVDRAAFLKIAEALYDQRGNGDAFKAPKPKKSTTEVTRETASDRAHTLAAKEFQRADPHRAKSKSKPKRGIIDVVDDFANINDSAPKRGGSRKDKKTAPADKEEAKKIKAENAVMLVKAKAKRRKRKVAKPELGGLVRKPGAYDHKEARPGIAGKLGKWFGTVGDIETETTVDRKDDGGKLTITNFFFDDDSTDEDSADGDDAALLGGARVIYDPREALQEYMRYIRREKAYKKDRVAKSHGIKMVSSLKKDKRNDVSSVDKPATTRGGGSIRAADAKAPSRSKENKEATLVQEQLRSLPTFEPHFITCITLAQFIVLCIMLFTAYSADQFAKVDIKESSESCNVASDRSSCPLSFNLVRDTEIQQKEPVNMWIGPDPAYLISYAAKFTPCMRADRRIEERLRDEYCAECVADVEFPNLLNTSANHDDCESKCSQAPAKFDPNAGEDISSIGNRYSCCAYQYKRYGMMTVDDCITKAKSDVQLYTDDTGVKHTRACYPDKGENIVVRPCCVGYNSMCYLYTEQQCDYVRGRWHGDKQLCSEVACLKETCDMAGYEATANAEFSNQIDSPSQSYRFIAPLFLHAGLIHFILCMVSC